MNLKNSIPLNLFLFLTMACFGQMETYSKKIELKGITDQWHNIVLPNAVFQTVKTDLSDIRIYGVTPSDTIEAPYLLSISKAIDANMMIPFELLNTVSNTKGFYYTYKLPTAEIINEIKLKFGNTNFDWQIMLEGSQDQKEWFTLLEEYRILSIQNEQTNYSYTHLKFPDAQFEYYRLRIKSTEKPRMESAKVSKVLKKLPNYRSYLVRDFNTTQENKNTIVDLDLRQRVPISYLQVYIADTIDYYRPVSIEYITDSTQTEKGIRYHYQSITNKMMLSSFESNTFTLNSTLTQKLRLTIRNHDNQPLTIDSISAKGYVHTLTARFNQPADYYLVFGNEQAQSPQYDISAMNIILPKNSEELKLGAPQPIPKKEITVTNPLFENQWWLWGIMTITIVVLGSYTLKMMQKKA